MLFYSLPLQCKLLADCPGLRHRGAEVGTFRPAPVSTGPRTKGVCMCLCVCVCVLHTFVSDWNMYIKNILLSMVQGSQAIALHPLLHACIVHIVLCKS